MTLLTRVFASLGAIIVAAGCQACSAQSCSLAGCVSGVSWSGDIPRSSEPQIVLRFELCKNGDCRTATGEFDTTIFSTSNLTLELGQSAYCDTTPNATTLILSCRFFYPTNTLANGDAYSLTVVDEGTNLTLVEKSVVVRYVAYSPNGRECGPTCLVGSLGD